MYWIASHYEIYPLLGNALGMPWRKIYFRLYRNSGKLDDMNIRISDEINRIINKEIDLVTMLKPMTKEDAEKFIT